jgi:predicted enzyme related to lactoylglutathione lyase
MLSEFASVAVTVSDGKKAKEWYSKTLGFKSKEEGHWITVWPRGSSLRIHLCETKELEKGNTGIALYCRDIEKEAQKLKKKGVNFTREVSDQGWGKFAMFSDPDGNIFWLIEGTP